MKNSGICCTLHSVAWVIVSLFAINMGLAALNIFNLFQMPFVHEHVMIFSWIIGLCGLFSLIALFWHMSHCMSKTEYKELHHSKPMALVVVGKLAWLLVSLGAVVALPIIASRWNFWDTTAHAHPIIAMVMGVAGIISLLGLIKHCYCCASSSCKVK
jgi:uncharacterized membrane protein YuzA (DUF378 family)